MVEDIKILAQLKPSATTLTDLYTCSSSSAVISKLEACNQSSSSRTYRLSIAPDGEADDTKHYFAYDTTIPANTTHTWSGITMNTNDKIRCYVSNADLSFNVFGCENTTSLPVQTAGGVLSGTYPSPGFASLSCVQSQNLKKTFYLMFNGGGGTRAVGCNATVVAIGGTFEVNDTSNIASQYNTDASANALASVSGGAYDEIRTSFNPKFYADFMVSTDTTAQRLWIGMFSASCALSDTSVGVADCIALRYSTTVPDTNFQIVTGDGAAQTVTDTGVAFDLGWHQLKLEVTGNGTSLTWTLDSATGTVTTNLPTTSQNLGYQAVLTTTTAATRRLRLAGLYCEQDY